MTVPPRLLALASASLPVRTSTGDLLHVPPPTIRERLETETALLWATKGDEEDLWLLFDHLSAWVPRDVWADLLLFDAGGMFSEIARLLEHHVRHMLDVLDTEPPKREPADQAPAAIDLRIALSDYCHVFGGDPWRVYNETPWPFFVALSLVRETASARQLLRMAEVEILPHTGKEAQESIQRLRERAGVGRRGADDGHGLHAPAEVIERDRAKLRELFGAPRPEAPDESGGAP